MAEIETNPPLLLRSRTLSGLAVVSQCGAPASQDHWIRSCPSEDTLTVRRETLSSAWDKVDSIQVAKGNRQNKYDYFNACSVLLDNAISSPEEKQLWLGILPQPVLADCSLRADHAPLHGLRQQT